MDTYAGNGACPGYYLNSSHKSTGHGDNRWIYSYYYTGGSAGNPAGKNYYSPGQDGTGGVIILVVHGKFIVNLGASITSNGSQAGATYHTGESYYYITTGVGNSGGGSINIFLKNLDYTNYRNYSSKWSFCYSNSSKWKRHGKHRQVLGNIRTLNCSSDDK